MVGIPMTSIKFLLYIKAAWSLPTNSNVSAEMAIINHLIKKLQIQLPLGARKIRQIHQVGLFNAISWGKD